MDIGHDFVEQPVRLPIAVKSIGVRFIVGGVGSVFDIVNHAIHGDIDFDIGVIGLWIG